MTGLRGLEDQVAIVTGGAGGLGAASARDPGAHNRALYGELWRALR